MTTEKQTLFNLFKKIKDNRKISITKEEQIYLLDLIRKEFKVLKILKGGLTKWE